MWPTIFKTSSEQLPIEEVRKPIPSFLIAVYWSDFYIFARLKKNEIFDVGVPTSLNQGQVTRLTFTPPQYREINLSDEPNTDAARRFNYCTSDSKCDTETCVHMITRSLPYVIIWYYCACYPWRACEKFNSILQRTVIYLWQWSTLSEPVSISWNFPRDAIQN